MILLVSFSCSKDEDEDAKDDEPIRIDLDGLTARQVALDMASALSVKVSVSCGIHLDGATPKEIAETIALVGVFGGVPAMTKAMELAREVMETGEDAA